MSSRHGPAKEPVVSGILSFEELANEGVDLLTEVQQIEDPDERRPAEDQVLRKLRERRLRQRRDPDDQ